MSRDRVADLKDRSFMLQRARSFFTEKGLFEVDCSALQTHPNNDRHIEPLSLLFNGCQRGYLHTSPEYAMKKLLTLGSGDIFYLGHVFRDRENGFLHSVEFTMAEWYRVNLPYEELMEEVCDFIRLFFPAEISLRLTYREAFFRYTGFDYRTASRRDLEDLLQKNLHMTLDSVKDSEEDLVMMAFTHLVEPALQSEDLVIIYDYPIDQAALAKTTTEDGFPAAKRFEIYYKGIELANGYDELNDPAELMNRFVENNRVREKHGGKPLEPDEDLLREIASLPPCSGVAVGFDRLLMIRRKMPELRMCLA